MRILEVQIDSPAWKGGIRAGDELLAVNGRPARDEIDFRFYGSDDRMLVRIRRRNREFTAELDGCCDPELIFEPMNITSCGNRCIFCFIDQNPPGMRKTLYFKDEDYRLSFLHGAYITLTTLREADIRRITRQRLSPLYVSVHATDPEVRRSMLGIRRDDRLLEKIDRLTAEGIVLHAQIVVCPDINDGSTLEKTIRDLRKRHPGIQSLAVVPVGMTKHRQGLCPLRPVDAKHARQTIALVDRFRKIYRDEAGSGFVCCSDEWYIRAGLEIPGIEYYDGFPQIENGVGMVRDFLDAADRLDTQEASPRYQGNITLVTGVSMSGYIREFAGRLSLCTGGEIRIVIVENDFYGNSATVSGLLTGGDIIRALKGTGAGETIVLPPNCLNHEGLFLDDLTPDDIAKTYGAQVKQAEWDPISTFFDAGKDRE